MARDDITSGIGKQQPAVTANPVASIKLIRISGLLRVTGPGCRNRPDYPSVQFNGGDSARRHPQYNLRILRRAAFISVRIAGVFASFGYIFKQELGLRLERPA